MVYKCFHKNSASLADKSAAGSGVATLANKSAIKNDNMSNQELSEQLHKPIIKSLKNEKYFHLLKATFGVLI